MIEQSPNDKRIYKLITLPNELKCLLVSDEESEKAAVAVDVQVGHLSDPDELQGLAHFCEHLLFIGSEKYPEENAYQSYLSKHGGQSNAFTDMENTNYYFDVNSEQLAGAMDIFAQFFISPLFSEGAIEREIQAVDSEHAKNVQNDFWRLFQLSKTLCRKDHPFSKFGTGNLETLQNEPKKLGIDIREELMKFHKKYYSANVMKLVVLGSQPITELEQMVIDSFSDVKNQGLRTPSFPGQPFTTNELKKQVEVVPVRDVRMVELHFPMREVTSLYKAKPCEYLSHLIGHEGSGSILSSLKSRGWANGLSAGKNRSCSDWSSFVITVELTDKGLDNVDDVVKVLFSYINLLRDGKPQRWIFDEIKTVTDCSFRFLSKRQPINYVCSLAGYMQLYEDEHILSGPYKVYEYNPAVIEECLSYLIPTNAMVVVVTQQLSNKTNLKEKWYGTDYSVKDIASMQLETWEAASNKSFDLRLPDRNDLIASDFSIKQDSMACADRPSLVMNDDSSRVWYKPDNIFNMPKLNVLMKLKTSVVNESPRSYALTALFVKVLNEHCNEFSYLASMANLHSSFSSDNTGLVINISGYSHKLIILLQKIVSAMVKVSSNVDDSLFDRVKDKILKQYQNFHYQQPYQHAVYGSSLCLENNYWTTDQKAEALVSLSIDDLKNFSDFLLERFFVEALVHGNATVEDATNFHQTVAKGIPSPTKPFDNDDVPYPRVVALEKRKEYIYRFAEYNKENTNSCVENLFQIGSVDFKTNAVLSFLMHIIQEPAFNELRTNEQLGYIVHSSIKTMGSNIKYIIILIQSEGYDPAYLDSRIEKFIERFRKDHIVSMSPEVFEANKTAVINQLLEKNKNLGEESSKYWQVITNGSYAFDKYQQIADNVKSLKLVQVLQFYDKFLAKDGNCRTKLSVQVYGKNHVELLDTIEDPESVGDGNTVIIQDTEQFKRGCTLFPYHESVDLEAYTRKA